MPPRSQQMTRSSVASSPAPEPSKLWFSGGARAGESLRILDQRNELTLRVAVAVDVALRRLNRTVPGEQLHVP
jgi:hypothetical protein